VGAVDETPVGLPVSDRRWPLIAARCGPTGARRAFHVRFLIHPFPTLQTGVDRAAAEARQERTNREPKSGTCGGVGDAGKSRRRPLRSVFRRDPRRRGGVGRRIAGVAPPSNTCRGVMQVAVQCRRAERIDSRTLCGSSGRERLLFGPREPTVGGVLCVKEMPLAASSTWFANESLRPLIEARPIFRHPWITDPFVQVSVMSLVIENDGVAEPWCAACTRCAAVPLLNLSFR
jgi:hypothetical protein